MTQRRVRFTATASTHLDRECTWWLANRQHQDLFAREIETAVQTLALLPGAGTPYTLSETPGLRRIYIRKLACHLYYTSNDEEVVIRAIWGAHREYGPGV